MFANAYQREFLCVFSSVGSRPLCMWGNEVKNGHIKRVVDQEVKSLVLEICGTNVATTYIYSPPKEKGSLGIRLPYFIMVIKNLKRYFTFEIEILDDRKNRRRFRVSNYQSQTAVHTFTCHMPLGLNPGWNQVQFNLADFTRRAYGSSYMETRRIQIHANCRIRCIYFADKIYSEDELPHEFKLYMPLGEKRLQVDQKVMPRKEEIEVSMTQQLFEKIATDEAVETTVEADIPKQEATAILDMITDLVMTKISSISKEVEEAKPTEGEGQQEPPAADASADAEAAAPPKQEAADSPESTAAETQDEASAEAPSEGEHAEGASEAEEEHTEEEETSAAETETAADASAEQPEAQPPEGQSEEPETERTPEA